MVKQIQTLESEAGFKALFQFATVGIVVVGNRGKIELVNPNAEELFGYQNAELIGQPLEVLIPQHLKKSHVGHREAYFDKPKARPMGKGMELFARKKDGREFPVEISLGYYELDGEMLAVAFVSDITERKKSVEDLKRLNAELSTLNERLESKVIERTLELTHALEREKELNDVKSRFVSMASHEFRTPLSTILSSISLVEKYTEIGEDDKRPKHFERIRLSVRNLTEILGDFLSLDKLEQGKTEFRIESISLPDFSKRITDGVEGMRKNGQQIRATHLGLANVVSDSKILGNILTNLLSNAIKYSEEGEIELITEVDEHRMLITVKDSGMGIPEEDQKHLFKMFHRARNAENIQGTGLGLNIVKRYVELLNGSISFISKVDKGTSFRMEFPLFLSRQMEPPANAELFDTPISVKWFDETGILCAKSKNTERTLAHYKELMALFARLISEKGGNKKICLLSDVSHSMPMSAEVNEYYSNELPNYVRAHAVISDIPIGATFGKAYQLLSEKGFPIRQFSNEKDAKEWLKQYCL